VGADEGGKPGVEAAVRKEARQRRWSLAALAVVLPLAFAVESHGSIADLAQSSELLASEVPSGAVAPYAGARWRLDTYKVVTGGDPLLAMPEDRALVVVRLGAEITENVDELWQICRLSLVDGEGRRFMPLFLALPGNVERLVEPDGRSAPSCGSVALSKPKPGAQVLMEEKFLVARAALPSLAPVVSTMGARPRYLRFRPPS